MRHGGPLSLAAHQDVYRGLLSRRVRLGQPVLCGERDGVKVYNSGGLTSGNYHIPFKRIFGIVSEQHPISEDQS